MVDATPEKARAFVADGFTLPEAKSQVDWLDQNTVFVGTDFGAGSLTDSGYPRVIKRWQRGQPLASAVTVYEGNVVVTQGTILLRAAQVTVTQDKNGGGDVAVRGGAHGHPGYGRERVRVG